jgi:hypothetical protein
LPHVRTRRFVLPRHRLIVAGAFRVAGFVVGVPSLLATLGCTVGAILFGAGSAPNHSPYLDTKTYGPTGAMANGAHAIGDIFTFIGTLASAILVVMAIAALAATLFGLLLYVTGRGLKVAAAWARIVAGLVSVLTLANCLIALSALTNDGKVVVGLLVAGLLYALWVLVWRFADPSPSPGHTTPAG